MLAHPDDFETFRKKDNPVINQLQQRAREIEEEIRQA